ncbi:hypothetical protein DAMA08_044760 [Martiniozyma asiatica (nom. inval.)]|nr:hypothetical protein DAMA08_044760 [Martiniozyma asiatica]
MLAKVDFSKLIDGILNSKTLTLLGIILHDLGRTSASLQLLQLAANNAKILKKIDIYLLIEEYAINDKNLCLAFEINQKALEILACIKPENLSHNMGPDLQERNQNLKMQLELNKLLKQRSVSSDCFYREIDEKYFSFKMNLISTFLENLPVELSNNFIFGFESTQNWEKFLTCEAHILGNLLSKNRDDVECVVHTLFNFIFYMPSQDVLVLKLLKIPKLKVNLSNLILKYLIFDDKLEFLSVEKIISVYDTFSKVKLEHDFLKFWKLWLEIKIILNLKAFFAKSTEPTEIKSNFLEISSFCQVIYEFVKFGTGDKHAKIKFAHKRERIIKKFLKEITEFRKKIIEIGLTSLYYIFILYQNYFFDLNYSNIFKEIGKEIRRNACMLESFISLACVDKIRFNIQKIEIISGYSNELLAQFENKRALFMEGVHPTLFKFNDFFLQRMISHYLAAISNSAIDDPIVPFLFDKILYGLLLHGEYNEATVYITKFIRDIAVLKSATSLISNEDESNFYSFFQTDTSVKDVLDLVVEKRFSYVQQKSQTGRQENSSSTILPQILMDKEKKIVFLPGYPSCNKDWQGIDISFPDQNINKSRLEANNEKIKLKNNISDIYLKTLLERLKIPIISHILNTNRGKAIINSVYPCNAYKTAHLPASNIEFKHFFFSAADKGKSNDPELGNYIRTHFTFSDRSS